MNGLNLMKGRLLEAQALNDDLLLKFSGVPENSEPQGYYFNLTLKFSYFDGNFEELPMDAY